MTVLLFAANENTPHVLTERWRASCPTTSEALNEVGNQLRSNMDDWNAPSRPGPRVARSASLLSPGAALGRQRTRPRAPNRFQACAWVGVPERQRPSLAVEVVTGIASSRSTLHRNLLILRVNVRGLPPNTRKFSLTFGCNLGVSTIRIEVGHLKKSWARRGASRRSRSGSHAR